jgi:tRNA nucleotidyltransferase (CCA-adding enzyme)
MALNEQNAVPQQRTWEHFSHAADIGMHGFGSTPAEAFEQAARTLTAVITDPDSVQARHIVEIRCENPDPELLLVDWLNALVYEMTVRSAGSPGWYRSSA